MVKKENGPLEKKDIPQHPDHKIDQDFPGFPHPPSTTEQVKPLTATEHKTADTANKDGEKVNYPDKNKINEQDSDGSGGAFEGTENPRD